MYKAVIFDFDYTLGDSTTGIAACIGYGLEKLGFQVPPLEAIRKTIGFTLPEAFVMLTGDRSPREARRFTDLFHEKADAVMVEGTHLIPGVKEQLQRMRAEGYRLAIVSTKRRCTIERFLRGAGAAELFDCIVGGEDVQTAKPAPEGLLAAMRALDVKREEVLYVGDSLVDAKTAANAHTAFAAVLTGTTSREELAGYSPVYTAESIADIYGYMAARG